MPRRTIEQPQPEPRFSRRQVLIGASLGIAATAGAIAIGTNINHARSFPEPSVQPTPEGSIRVYDTLEELVGESLITDERFNELTQALADSGKPLLQKVASDVTTLHTSRDNPPELPTIIVDERTTPLPIARIYSNTSTAHLYVPSDDNSQDGFMIVNGIDHYKWMFSKPAQLAITIGTDEHIEATDPIEEALYLAKEHLSLMVMLRMVSNYERFLSTGYKFEELDGSKMIDPQRLAMAGLAVGSRAFNNNSSEPWTFADIAPILLLVPPIVDLINEGKLPRETTTLTPFVNAANVINDTGNLDAVYRFSDKWAGSSSMLGQKDLAKDLYRPEVYDAILAVNDLFYGPTSQKSDQRRFASLDTVSGRSIA